jgi:hypothetical protein
MTQQNMVIQGRVLGQYRCDAGQYWAQSALSSGENEWCVLPKNLGMNTNKGANSAIRGMHGCHRHSKN